MVEFIDAESYVGTGEEKLTFREIVLLFLRRIGSNSNVEFRGGYYTVTQTKTGLEKENYVQDSREVYANSVDYFYNILHPHFDKAMKKLGDEFDKELTKIKEEFIKASSVKEEVILGEGFYTSETDKILLETYKEKKLRLYLGLFRNLSGFLFRSKYLKKKMFVDKDTKE